MVRGVITMEPNEEQSLFDAKIVLTFPAYDEEDAVDQLDELLSKLEDQGFSLGPATVEESVSLTYD